MSGKAKKKIEERERGQEEEGKKKKKKKLYFTTEFHQSLQIAFHESRSILYTIAFLLPIQ